MYVVCYSAVHKVWVVYRLCTKIYCICTSVLSGASNCLKPEANFNTAIYNLHNSLQFEAEVTPSFPLAFTVEESIKNSKTFSKESTKPLHIFSWRYQIAFSCQNILYNVKLDQNSLCRCYDLGNILLSESCQGQQYLAQFRMLTCQSETVPKWCKLQTRAHAIQYCYSIKLDLLDIRVSVSLCL